MKTYQDPEEQMFAMLMQKFAEEEGRRLIEENERLLNDPSAAVPPELDRKCRELILRAFSGQKHTKKQL